MEAGGRGWRRGAVHRSGCVSEEGRQEERCRHDDRDSEDGQWLVADEVTPGTYRTQESDCYYQRLSGFTGDIHDIIANGSTSASGGSVTIKATKVVRFAVRMDSTPGLTVTPPNGGSVVGKSVAS